MGESFLRGFFGLMASAFLGGSFVEFYLFYFTPSILLVALRLEMSCFQVNRELKLDRRDNWFM